MSLAIAIPIGVSLLVVLIGLDVYLAVDGVKGNTWSEILRSWGQSNGLAAWIWCGLAGHYWHWMEKSKPVIKQPGNIALLVWLTILVYIVTTAATRSGIPIPSWSIAPIAFVVWALLWPV